MGRTTRTVSDAQKENNPQKIIFSHAPKKNKSKGTTTSAVTTTTSKVTTTTRTPFSYVPLSSKRDNPKKFPFFNQDQIKCFYLEKIGDTHTVCKNIITVQCLLKYNKVLSKYRFDKYGIIESNF